MKFGIKDIFKKYLTAQTNNRIHLCSVFDKPFLSGAHLVNEHGKVVFLPHSKTCFFRPLPFRLLSVYGRFSPRVQKQPRALICETFDRSLRRPGIEKCNYKRGVSRHEAITVFGRQGRLLLCGGKPASVYMPTRLPGSHQPTFIEEA